MTKFEQDVISGLARLENEVKGIKEALERDRVILHGNGRPGLLHRVAALELNWRWVKYLAGVIGASAGYVAAFFTKN